MYFEKFTWVCLPEYWLAPDLLAWSTARPWR
jgi:hypothetical protein